MRPVCCGKNATPYVIVYKSNWWPSFEQGFRCKKCGRNRIPFMDSFDMTYMNSLEAVRLAGIAFDESLSGGAA